MLAGELTYSLWAVFWDQFILTEVRSCPVGLARFSKCSCLLLQYQGTKPDAYMVLLTTH